MEKRHRCEWDNNENFDYNRSAFIDYCKVSDEWNLIASSGIYESEVSVVVPIKFCPFCGEELD